MANTNGSVIEVGRLAPADGDSLGQSIDPNGGFCSLLVENPLQAVVWISFNASGNASETAHDIAAPGQSRSTYPLPANCPGLSAAVDYQGVPPPAADANLFAIVAVTPSNLGATVSPLS